MAAVAPPLAPAEPRRPAPPAVPGEASQRSTAAESASGRILFATDGIDLPDDAAPLLERVAAAARQQDRRVIVIAHAGAAAPDASAGAAAPDTSRSRRVSLARALGVRAALMERGVASTRIDVRAMGVPLDQEQPDRVEVSLGPVASLAQQGAR